MAEKREWNLSSLKDAGVVLIDCDHRTPPAAEAGYPYIAIPQLKNGRIDLSEVRKISPTHFEEWTRKANPQHYDVILSRRCNPGETAHVPPNLKCALGQNLVLLRADGKKVLPQYLRWITQGPLWWEQISKFINVGAVFDSLRCADVPNFELPLPPISEQRAIAAVLEALDNKIGLNQRMNDTLEGIAQALFKSWFVDFDPVKAKAQGREPEGMDKETALLFPDSFEDSALGKIPKRWKIGRVSDVSEVTDFVANGSFESLRNNVKYTSDPDYAILVRLVDFNHGWKGNYVYLSESAYTFLKKSALEPDDVLIANVGANAGTVFKVPNLGKPMTLGPNAIVLKPIETIGISKQYLYYLFSSPEGQQQLQSILSGSAQPKFNKTDMRALKIAIPSHEVLNLFKQLTKALWERQRVIHSETETLTKFRDTLLPRLISGELRVGEISDIVEALAL